MGGEGTIEDEMVGWHHQCKGHEFEQALGVVDGQGILACCSPWDCRESNMTELTELNIQVRVSFYIIIFSGICPVVGLLDYKVVGEENGNPLQYSCLENSMDKHS